MIFKNGHEKVSFKNSMLWLLLTEINRMYDMVFLFPSKDSQEQEYNFERYTKAKRYLLNKINCD